MLSCEDGAALLADRALLGSGVSRLLHSRARLRAFNIAMTLLLVASLVPVLIEG